MQVNKIIKERVVLLSAVSVRAGFKRKFLQVLREFKANAAFGKNSALVKDESLEKFCALITQILPR